MHKNMGSGLCSLAMGDSFSQALGAASEYLSDMSTDFSGAGDGECSFRQCASEMHDNLKHYAYPDPSKIYILDEYSES